MLDPLYNLMFRFLIKPFNKKAKLQQKDKGIFKDHNKFYYNKNSKLVTDDLILERLKKIYIPPAWKSVWYASNKKCHIQAHGIDAGGKKQYILSAQWVNFKSEEKFIKMKKFIQLLPSFKKKIILTNLDLNKEFLIKLLFNLLIDTHMRVGNEIYANENKTYGLTTLKQKHLIMIN
jgi:DNA topoisomerase-1